MSCCHFIYTSGRCSRHGSIHWKSADIIDSVGIFRFDIDIMQILQSWIVKSDELVSCVFFQSLQENNVK
jgi:hypothetical protein